MDNSRTGQYLSGDDPHQNICIHHCVISNSLQLSALDVAELSSHDPQVGHGFWGLLILQIFNQLVEVADDFSDKIFWNLRKIYYFISANDNIT